MKCPEIESVEAGTLMHGCRSVIAYDANSLYPTTAMRVDFFTGHESACVITLRIMMCLRGIWIIWNVMLPGVILKQ